MASDLPVSPGRRIGMIGLDSSHCLEFTKSLNTCPDGRFDGFKVTVAYPYGSHRIESSYSRIPGYTEEVKQLGVQIKDSVQDLLQDCDFVFLETNDGNLHLQQATQAMQAGKVLFIDKPLAANIRDVQAIYDASRKYKVPFFTSSPLRYVDNLLSIRNGSLAGKVLGAGTYAPCDNEPSHTDFFWYGIHGIEILFTAMGSGCERVQCVHTEAADIVTGVWDDGRLGVFRGTREGMHEYGGTAFCERGDILISPYSGYDGLLKNIISFFKSGILPVEERETKDIYAFMNAAALSIKGNGSWQNLEKI